MSRPTVTQAQAWRPEALRGLARRTGTGWPAAIGGEADAVLALTRGTEEHWDGAAAEAARRQAGALIADAAAAARRLIAASVAATDGADQLTVARDDVLDTLARARRDGLAVAEDGSVTRTGAPDPLLVLLAGGDAGAAGQMLDVAAAQAHGRIAAALDRLGAADADAASDLAAALTGDTGRTPAATVPAGACAGPPPDPVAGLADDEPGRHRRPDRRDDIRAARPPGRGVPAAGRQHRRCAMGHAGRCEPDQHRRQPSLAESGRDTEFRRRIALYRGLLGEIDDPARTGDRIRRQILAFDPARASLVELNGDLANAHSVAVLVPGVNTTIEGSAATTATARRFVSGHPRRRRGDHLPRRTVPPGARSRRRCCSRPPTRAAHSTWRPAWWPSARTSTARWPRGVPVTVIGHSYGGSIVGTAEALGLTVGPHAVPGRRRAGVGVDDPSDWHNRNPDVLRFSMTAPGDFIEAVQGIPGGPHGADPDEMPGVIRLATGYYDDGRPVAGWDAHSGMLNRPSDSWRTVLAVITGDSETLHHAVADAPQ